MKHYRTHLHALFASLLTVTCYIATAAEGPVPFQPANPLPAPSNPPLKQIQPGVFELGKVRLNKTERTVTFPGVMNMDQGLIEYVVVHGSGKIHESLLRTDAEPYHVHLAILLISDKQGTNAPSTPSATSIAQNVRIWITWKQADQQRRVPAEDLILNVETKKPMSRGPWRYVGSRVVDGTFLAQRDGSLIAVIDDPDALVNNSRPGSEDDENWQVQQGNRPEVETPVEISIQLEKTTKSGI